MAILYALETFIFQAHWMEIGIHLSLGIAVYALLDEYNVRDGLTYTLLIVGLLWLTLDAIFERVLKIARPLQLPLQFASGIFVFINSVYLVANLDMNAIPAMISFGVYTIFFIAYARYRKNALLGYLASYYLPLSILALLEYLHQDRWLLPQIIVAVLYYGISFLVGKEEKQVEWRKMLERSSLILGTLVALSAPLENSGLVASFPVAVTATLFAIHAFRNKNVWFGFPANAFYLMSYFMILSNFEVDQPQFFSVVAAALGMLMHYLLVRSENESKTAAFITGMLSQLVLLSTTYFQMVSEEEFIYFVVLFFQAIAVLVYGIITRSRSLVITPIIFLVVSVLTITFGLLEGLGTLILIGCSGIFLILFGIGALLLRERFSTLREKLDDWNA